MGDCSRWRSTREENVSSFEAFVSLDENQVEVLVSPGRSSAHSAGYPKLPLQSQIPLFRNLSWFDVKTESSQFERLLPWLTDSGRKWKLDPCLEACDSTWFSWQVSVLSDRAVSLQPQLLS